ncbi:uncharacterized protein METZ01_LOCUS306153, partial [marine metagenome]
RTHATHEILRYGSLSVGKDLASDATH